MSGASRAGSPVTERLGAGLALAFVAVTLWGAQFPIAKDAFATIDPFHVSAIRYGVAVLLLVPIVVALEGRGALRYYGRLAPASLLGLTGMTASPLLVFSGLALTRPEHAAIIIALQPSMTAIADWAVHGRRPARFTLGCIAIAFVGVVLVVTRGDPTLAMGQHELLGSLLVLVGAACWVVYTMGSASFGGWSALKFTILTLAPGTVGLIVATALAVPMGLARVPSAADIAATGGPLLFLALGGVLAAMICWNAGTKRIGALNSMLMLNMVPVVTFVFRFLQGQRFAPVELAGAALVIGALVANNLYLRRLHLARLAAERAATAVR